VSSYTKWDRADYIDALGPGLNLVVSFGDHTLTVVATEAA